MTAFASEGVPSEMVSTGDAIQDILVDGRFRGALHTISKITEFVDIWFIRIISIISFFIISAALLKNACAGAYCANSKFWDKVADAHQKNDAISIATVQQYFGGGQFKNTNVGSLKDFLLGLIPNIKAFTDFDDADIEPKAYFMKAIPQMIACVIIGVFIYNGYYRDTAAKVGEMGSVLVSRTLNSVNPESLINSVFNATSWPDFPWEGDVSEEGKGYLKIAKELKSLVSSNFSDVTTADDKAECVGNIVNAINSGSGEIPWDSAGEDYIYKMSNVKSYVSASANIDNLNVGCNVRNGTPGETDVNFVWVFAMHTDAGAIVPATTQGTTANQYGYVSFTLKREVSKDGEQQLSGVNASVANNSKLAEELNNLKPFEVPGTDFMYTDSGVNKTKGGEIPVTVFGLSSADNLMFNCTLGTDAVLMKNGVLSIKKDVPINKLEQDSTTGMSRIELGYLTPANGTTPRGYVYVLLSNGGGN